MADMELTPEQVKEIEGVRDFWLANQCREVSLDEVETAVRQIYTVAELKIPKVELHNGPKACVDAYKAEMAKRKLKLPSEMPVWCCMWWQAWAAYYEGGKKVGQQYDEKEYKTFRDWCWAVPICIPLEEICYVSKWPTQMSWDEQGRLHSVTGPAIAFRDNFKVWMINGVDVTEQVVMSPETQTVEQIDKESNEEVRRIRIERFAGADKPVDEGWIKYITESGATKVHTRLNERDGQWETLYRFKDGRQRMVVVDPSTGRRYALGVPREIKHTQEAQDWMHHGLDKLCIHRS